MKRLMGGLVILFALCIGFSTVGCGGNKTKDKTKTETTTKETHKEGNGGTVGTKETKETTKKEGTTPGTGTKKEETKKEETKKEETKKGGGAAGKQSFRLDLNQTRHLAMAEPVVEGMIAEQAVLPARATFIRRNGQGVSA